MAPELSSGRMDSCVQVGSEPFKVDVFSLGILAYIAFVKLHPFADPRTGLGENSRILRDEWDHCTGANWSRVPAPARKLVCKMLAHKPTDRYDIDQVLSDPWLQAHARVDEDETVDLPANDGGAAEGMQEEEAEPMDL